MTEMRMVPMIEMRMVAVNVNDGSIQGELEVYGAGAEPHQGASPALLPLTQT